MTISRTLGLAIIAGTGIIGALLGRAMQRDAQSDHADGSISPAPSVITPADDECKADRTALALIKAQLTICMGSVTRDSETEPSDVREQPEPEPTVRKSQLEKVLEEEVKTYKERLESLPEAVIVRHSNGTVRVYKPDEWPSDGDGVIVGRKFKDGRIERYPMGKRPSAPQ